MKRQIIVLCLLAAILIGGTCTEEQVEQILAQGTNYKFENRESVDLVLVLDRSGSMRGEKIQQAKDAASQLVQALSNGDRAAVIGFDSSAAVYHQFSSNSRDLQGSISRIDVGDFTNYGKALQEAQNLFNGNKKIIMFLSDGQPDDNREQLDALVQEIVSQDVCIYTIGYAVSEDPKAQEILSSIAQTSQATTGCGEYYNVEQGDVELRSIFREIYSDVSASNLFLVDAELEEREETTVTFKAESSLNGQDILASNCFTPEFNIVLNKDGKVVEDITTMEPVTTLRLLPGEYLFRLTVVETCGGQCFFTGSKVGSFTITREIDACYTEWEEMNVLLNNQDYVEIQITNKGFSPQTAGTEGVVVWKNIDTSNHKVVGTNINFSSPVINPGESWSYVFPPGSYTYTDTQASFEGMFNNEKILTHDPVDLVLVLDRSGSMQGTPLTSAKIAADNLVSIISPTDRAGIIVFSGNTRTIRSLTSDVRLLRSAIQEIGAEGSTYYLEALEQIRYQIGRSTPNRKQLVIFLSDGLPSDQGGKEAILDKLDEVIDGACFYAIGYGNQDPEATELLQSMADLVQKKNQCGLFYYASAEKTELSKVFGEIYARTQNPGLEIFDIQVPPNPKGTFTITARVRSMRNGISVPSDNQFGCIPAAAVFLDIDGERFHMRHNGKVYEAVVSLPPGEHKGNILARLTAPDNDARSVIGSVQVTINIGHTNWLLWGLVGLGAVMAGMIIIGGRHTTTHGTTGARAATRARHT